MSDHIDLYYCKDPAFTWRNTEEPTWSVSICSLLAEILTRATRDHNIHKTVLKLGDNVEIDSEGF
jgi:hypothetical protein